MIVEKKIMIIFLQLSYAGFKFCLDISQPQNRRKNSFIGFICSLRIDNSCCGTGAVHILWNDTIIHLFRKR